MYAMVAPRSHTENDDFSFASSVFSVLLIALRAVVSINKHDKCVFWASIKECTKNPVRNRFIPCRIFCWIRRLRQNADACCRRCTPMKPGLHGEQLHAGMSKMR